MHAQMRMAGVTAASRLRHDFTCNITKISKGEDEKKTAKPAKVAAAAVAAATATIIIAITTTSADVV